jgi:hypothetical protein
VKVARGFAVPPAGSSIFWIRFNCRCKLKTVSFLELAPEMLDEHFDEIAAKTAIHREEPSRKKCRFDEAAAPLESSSSK